jgi:hypothetical protein
MWGAPSIKKAKPKIFNLVGKEGAKEELVG